VPILLRVALYYHTRWRSVVDAFAEGIRRFGHETEVRDLSDYLLVPCDYVVRLGAGTPTKLLDRDLSEYQIPFLCISDGCIRRWRDWFGTEHGYRNTYNDEPFWTIARNGAHAYGEHVPFSKPGPERWESFGIEVAPWRETGDHIIYAHQCHTYPWTYSNPPKDRRPWYKHVAATLQQVTDRPVIFKPHPKEQLDAKELHRQLEGVAPGRFLYSERSLRALLINAWALVTYDSNAAVEAVINGGIPIFTGNRTMAEPVANRDLLFIDEPELPDRRQWLNWFAWTQWTVEEMRTGEPWAALVES